jgi:isocitrate lyase
VPAKSKKQERFMQAVANNPKFAKKVGDRAKKQGEIEEFIRRDNSIYRTKKAKERGLKTLSERMKRERKETRDIKIFGKKKGGEVKQMKKGGMVKRGDGCAIKGKTKGRMV